MDATQDRGDLKDDATAFATPSDAWKTWGVALKAAQDWDKEWREEAQKTLELYRMTGKDGKKAKFNILHSNTATILPAVFSAVPIPDVRPSLGVSNKDENVVQVQRALDSELRLLTNQETFEDAVKTTVFDACLTGRGVCRLQYSAETDEAKGLIGTQSVFIQHVAYTDFLHTPADKWEDVWWVAFKHKLTRDDVRAIAPDYVDKLSYNEADTNVNLEQAEKERINTDCFARTVIWEIWDQQRKKVVFWAQSYNQGPLLVMDPIIQVSGFFPMPRPVYGVQTGTLLPMVPYKLYRELAREMDTLTARMTGLLEAVKANGICDPRLATAVERLANVDDNQIVPAEAFKEMADFVKGAGGGMKDAIWMRPIEQTVQVIAQLALQRDRVKQAIYELTGISDIMRGTTNADETLGAQQIKNNWGTARISVFKSAVERMVRTIFRHASEIVADKFETHVIAAATGVELTPEQQALMRSDVLRSYMIDVETDSTVQPDLKAQQQDITSFVSGLGGFVKAVAPAVQSGLFPTSLAAEMIRSFSKTFKLGRNVEDMLDDLAQQAAEREKLEAQQAAEREKLEAQQAAALQAQQVGILPGVVPQQPVPMGALQ